MYYSIDSYVVVFLLTFENVLKICSIFFRWVKVFFVGFLLVKIHFGE